MQRDSWQLLSTGDAEEFVDTLRREAGEHPAVHHTYLKRLAAGDVPNIVDALRDYAYQYSFYGAEFPSYVEGVLGGLTRSDHRDVLLENLHEEKGDPDSDDLDKMPHTRLFGLFKRAVGATQEYERNTSPCTTVLVWRDLFLQKCQSRQNGVGVGAIGLGTELVVPTMYRYILESIIEHTDLTPRDYHFFNLHVECDAEHARDLMNITTELASDHDVREAVRFGVFSSLNLRKAFWDVMLSRAVAMSRD